MERQAAPRADLKSTPLGRRRKCPECGSASVAHILYGLPAAPDEEMQRQLDSGRIVFGGCCVFPESPDRVCNECGYAWRPTRKIIGRPQRPGFPRSRGRR